MRIEEEEIWNLVYSRAFTDHALSDAEPGQTEEQRTANEQVAAGIAVRLANSAVIRLREMRQLDPNVGRTILELTETKKPREPNGSPPAFFGQPRSPRP